MKLNLLNEQTEYQGLSGFQIKHSGGKSDDIFFIDGGNHFFARMCPGVDLDIALKTAQLIENSPELLQLVGKLAEQLYKSTMFMNLVPNNKYGNHYLICSENDKLVEESVNLLKEICK